MTWPPSLRIRSVASSLNMRVTREPWFVTLLAYALLVSIFFIYGHASFYCDPGSIFFDQDRAFERKYSFDRELQVKAFISDLVTESRGQAPHVGSDPSLCVAFLSVRRDGEQYLPLAVASSIQGMSTCERADLYLDVLLAHTDVNIHPSSRLAWLHELADNIHGYNVSSEAITKLEHMEQEKDFSQKAVLDYVHALQTCYDTRSPWIAVFEDDIILGEGWFVKTLQGLDTIKRSLKNQADNWLFMRLFNQERSTGWASRTPGQNYEFLISAALDTAILSVLFLLRRRYRVVRRKIDDTSIAIVCMLVVPTFVILFFQAGKASMLPPKPGVRKEAFGCCSQGLVFPREQVPRIQTFLTSKGRGQIDLMLNELARRDSLDRYALYPVQLQHLGQRSVRGTTADEAQAVWSMAFEQQNARELRDIHDHLAKSTYGPECFT